MIESNNYIKEVYSMLSNVCFPTIHHVIKESLEKFLYQVEDVLDNKDFMYLIHIMKEFNIKEIENNQDKLNVNLVEFTYALYEVWLEFIQVNTDDELIIPYQIDKTFIDETSDAFFNCILNEGLLSIYQKFHEFEEMKKKLTETIIIDKYRDNVISGAKKHYESMSERISHVFKVLRTNLSFIDADSYLYEFIDEYEKYCQMIQDVLVILSDVMNQCQKEYLEQCVIVFGDKITSLYQTLEDNKIQIDLIDLKIHILQFLQFTLTP